MSNSNLDDCMSWQYTSQEDWEESWFGRGAGDPDHWGNPDEDAYHAKQARVKEQQDKIEYFSSSEFKESEQIRREASKVTEHVAVDFNRVWCPVYSKVRPEWLCANECEADEPNNLDYDWSQDE